MQRFLEKTVEVDVQDGGEGSGRIIIEYFLTKNSTDELDGNAETGDVYGIGITCRKKGCNERSGSRDTYGGGSFVCRETPADDRYAGTYSICGSNFIECISDKSNEVRSLLDVMIYNTVLPDELSVILDDIMGGDSAL